VQRKGCAPDDEASGDLDGQLVGLQHGFFLTVESGRMAQRWPAQGVSERSRARLKAKSRADVYMGPS
jgi:hypothetical protein